MIPFCCCYSFIFGTYPVLCTQGSHLAGSGGPSGMPGTDPQSATCKKNIQPAILPFRPLTHHFLHLTMYLKIRTYIDTQNYLVLNCPTSVLSYTNSTRSLIAVSFPMTNYKKQLLMHSLIWIALNLYNNCGKVVDTSSHLQRDKFSLIWKKKNWLPCSL